MGIYITFLYARLLFNHFSSINTLILFLATLHMIITFLLHDVKAVIQKSLATHGLFNIVIEFGFGLGKSRINNMTKMFHHYPLTRKFIAFFESAARIYLTS